VQEIESVYGNKTLGTACCGYSCRRVTCIVPPQTRASLNRDHKQSNSDPLCWPRSFTVSLFSQINHETLYSVVCANLQLKEERREGSTLLHPGSHLFDRPQNLVSALSCAGAGRANRVDPSPHFPPGAGPGTFSGPVDEVCECVTAGRIEKRTANQT